MSSVAAEGFETEETCHDQREQAKAKCNGKGGRRGAGKGKGRANEARLLFKKEVSTVSSMMKKRALSDVAKCMCVLCLCAQTVNAMAGTGDATDGDAAAVAAVLSLCMCGSMLVQMTLITGLDSPLALTRSNSTVIREGLAGPLSDMSPLSRRTTIHVDLMTFVNPAGAQVRTKPLSHLISTLTPRST